MRRSRRGISGLSEVSDLGNKKGPEEGPGAPSEFGWHLAIPGGAPGYDYDKFGNNITHKAARTFQRLREHTVQWPKVKPSGAESAET
jgi:hypothetical protein